MEAKELMQFDWVCLEDDSTPRQVDFIRTGEVGLYWNKIVTPPYIKPIPLTPEILEKNGFVKLLNQYVLKADKEPFIHLILLDNLPNANGRMLVAIKDRYTNAKIAITYVHELQHALRLCRIEKEIIL